MSRLVFTESIAVGIEEIDEQHQDLIAMVNGLYDMVGTEVPPSLLSDLVGEMLNYAELHFAAEEKYMELTGYPDLEKHREEHGIFRKAAGEFQQKDTAGDLTVMELFSFLSNWFMVHLVESDGRYAAYCREQEIV